jgi:DNA mismatch repair protein MSH6
MCHPLRSAGDINARLDASDTLNSLPQIRDHFLSTFNRLPDLERILSRIHAGRCKVKDFVRVLEGFEVIMEGIEQIKQTAEMHEVTSQGLLGKLLVAFDGLGALLQGWEHAFDWERAKEEGLSLKIARLIIDLLIPMKGVEEDFDESNAKLDRILEDLETFRKGYQQTYKSLHSLVKI